MASQVEIVVGTGSCLNEVNYYERKIERALFQISKLVTLVEKNYLEAIESCQRALSILEKAKSECSCDDSEFHVIQARQEILESQFAALHPYKPLLSRPSVFGSGVPRGDSAVLSGDNLERRVSQPNQRDRCLLDLQNFPTQKVRRLEECEVRIVELEKMVDMLSLKLEASERHATLEENARLVAEGELLLLRRPQTNWTEVVDHSSNSSPLTSLIPDTASDVDTASLNIDRVS